MNSLVNRKLNLFLLIVVACLSGCNTTPAENTPNEPVERKIAVVIHGGAGTVSRENMDSVTEVAYRAKLDEALQAAYTILEDGGSSCDAIQAAIVMMENSPLFNAGVGAVFTATGENELDASIMRGEDLNAGAVAGVKTVKNPILAAYQVMINSPHVMLAREGAEQFAKERGLELVDPSYFSTDPRKAQLEKAIKKVEKEYGTVGAVAVDRQGNICAATSTGGMTNKKWGRIGDSPVIGAGTYANNNTCGFSGTGHGEYYIRTAAAHDVSALMEYKNLSVEEAAQTVMDKITKMDALGGMIAMDRFGNVAMPFNTSGMYRGYRKEGEMAVIKIFQGE
ncbi:isoaspartyl peptidase/L-asparaginase family protein [Marinoscillum sp. 108]|uniref:isoaspartyl peptidase/L-asparaginase family protein n=1 Tax=Marinoscillum sp. 108 TaxID=2653151 RepID=UPI0012EFECD4|nr:isoaspartyl peptidase/L-asparaginase [Marinoscillum sp. 108]VXD17639.1 Isoaspartyl peptidase [Marinoscillum sp. 108]